MKSNDDKIDVNKTGANIQLNFVFNSDSSMDIVKCLWFIAPNYNAVCLFHFILFLLILKSTGDTDNLCAIAFYSVILLR